MGKQKAFRWRIYQGMTKGHGWKYFIGDFYFCVNLPLTDKFLLIFVFIEFEKTSWKSCFILEERFQWYWYLFVKTEIYLSDDLLLSTTFPLLLVPLHEQSLVVVRAHDHAGTVSNIYPAYAAGPIFIQWKNILTHYSLVLLFYTPWKHQKTFRFSDLLGGTEKQYRL